MKKSTKKSEQKEYLKYRNDPLSNLDLDDGLKILREKQKFDDANLTPHTDIETIFSNRGHSIIFHRYPNQECGHWYTVLRTPDKKVYFIDSFGKHCDYYNKNWLPCLKNNGIKEIYINNKKYQHDKSAVCGRWGLLFCTCHKYGLNTDQIHKLIEDGKKKYGSYDNFVLYMTT